MTRPANSEQQIAGAEQVGGPDRPSRPEPLGGAEPLALAGRPDGRKRLNPYLTGGITEDWTAYLVAYQDAGADGIEIGLPFSDPVLDGVTIQEASDRALARGATVAGILRDVAAVRQRLHIPLIAMTYANLVFRAGPDHFCRQLAAAGFSGLIVPDLPVDEAAAVEEAARAAGLDLVMLVAPVTPDERLAEIVTRGGGFLYAVSVMGTTGERNRLAGSAARLAARVKAITDRPVLIGFGISGPAQAAEAARVSDGVVVGAALMRRVLDGATPDDLRDDVAALRSALDSEVSAAYSQISGHRD
jgi:tryptophan synthase alpha chain